MTAASLIFQILFLSVLVQFTLEPSAYAKTESAKQKASDSKATAEKPAAVFTLEVDKAQGQTEFLAIGRPSALRIHGKGNAPKGSIRVEGSKASGVITFDLSSLDTGMSLRNQHMKEKYLETDRYPTAKLTIKDLIVPQSLREGDGTETVTFTAPLSLHGVEKDVTVKSSLRRTGEQMSIDANFKTRLEHFNISAPSFAGVTIPVAEDIEVTVKLSAPFIAAESVK